MDIDLRIPMGMMFSMIGAVLLAFGLATRDRAEMYTKSFGMNVDLAWGAAVLVFGLVVLQLGRRGQGTIEERKKAGTKSPQRRRPVLTPTSTNRSSGTPSVVGDPDGKKGTRDEGPGTRDQGTREQGKKGLGTRG